MAAISHAVVQKGAKILRNDEELPCITVMKNMMHLMADERIMYNMVIHTEFVLCHPRNRGGLGINGYQAHMNGARVHRVGADTRELHGAVCVEIATDPVEREMQLQFNKDQVENAAGLLADVSTRERYLSMGCGHMAAFCRAANAGCRIQITIQGSTIRADSSWTICLFFFLFCFFLQKY